MAAPDLEGQALAAVEHRGSHLQIIASAGSGKTEVVSQRVARLVEEGAAPESIVAFTFTEKAAEELKGRIQQRVREFVGEEAIGPLARLYVGTIHSYCFRLLQEFAPRYDAWDVLEDNQLAAFLSREGNRLRVKQLDSRNRLFASIRTFIANADVVENELIPMEALDEPFRSIYRDYVARLEDYRALTFGQIIRRAIEELQRLEVFERVHEPLRHLIVDEYQDVNPAQERLVELLAQDPVELCVVGDDDQSIYQWRGTNVSNIVEFTDRYPGTASFTIGENRRSRPSIVKLANSCSALIEGRLDKAMDPVRSAGGEEVIAFGAPTEQQQAELIAVHVRNAHALGYRYSDMAVLVRSRTSLGAVLDALEGADIPVEPGGRTNLFLQPDAQTFGRLCAWLVDHDWREEVWAQGQEVTLEDLCAEFGDAFDLDAKGRKALKNFLEAWKQEVFNPTERANFVRDWYRLLDLLGVADWDFSSAEATTRLGVLARCSQILADYESVKRRARRDPDAPGEIVGGQDRGDWHYRWLAIFVQNYALGAYEDFDGEDFLDLDAVEVTTVHQAKGLEWPIVLVPSLIAGRFPSSNTGRQRATWFVPTDLFDEDRYNGTTNDERRLFYVALTRARDQLCLSRFGAHAKGSTTRPSQFLEEVDLLDTELDDPASLPDPASPEAAGPEDAISEVTLSDLVLYDSCGLSFRLRSQLGFQPTLAPELGYGRAVHHILRQVAEHVRRSGKPPTPAQLDKLFDEEFYLPIANKAAHRELKGSARALVNRYIADWGDDLERVWAVERPFELRLETGLVSGRADVILDDSGGGPPVLSIVDYKTATGEEDAFDFQLRVYTDAGRGEGLDVASAYVHDLRKADRRPIDVSSGSVASARSKVEELVGHMRAGEYEPKPGPVCKRCDVAPICRYRATS